jgi:hypothetical protein
VDPIFVLQDLMLLFGQASNPDQGSGRTRVQLRFGIQRLHCALMKNPELT